MSIDIVPIRPEYVSELARIVFEAFKGIQEHHRFPLDIPSAEVASHMLGMFIGRSDFHGVAAMVDGKIAGSNFVQTSDPVGGIGPITVNCAVQGRGIGKTLMRSIMDWSLANHGPMLRLVQESFNLRSLSLYTSLGFTVVEPLTLMNVSPASQDDPQVRPLTPDDLPACDSLCRRILEVSRKNELAMMIEHGPAIGAVPHGRFRSGSLHAYLIPGFFGHGVGESVDDLLVTAAHVARHTPPHLHRLFIPIRHGDFLRQALRRSFRCLKPMNLMALGPYQSPPTTGPAWSPSITY